MFIHFIGFFRASRWYCLFFVLFVLLGVYFVTNLVLAVVYDSFKSEVPRTKKLLIRISLRMQKSFYCVLLMYSLKKFEMSADTTKICYFLQLVKQVFEMDQMRRKMLGKAFDLLDHNVSLFFFIFICCHGPL